MVPRLSPWGLCLLTVLCANSPFCHGEPSAPEQGVTFSHVYKIDIPGSPGCKVESLPPKEQTGLQTQTSSNGENDIVFRHNIRLQTPACDCAESEDFKSLLYRVNGLEEEVNYLKTQCTQGCCGGGIGGGIGVDTTCSGRGTYQQMTCSCICNPGWEGPDCSSSTCPDDCNDNGRCVDGKCVCHQGYAGHDCSQATCPGDCNDKGRCVDGKCVCFAHFSGEDCGVAKCPNDCVGNGRCVDGQCVCEEGFFGEDCSLVLGPQGLRVVQVTDVSLLVEWESVRGAEYYVLTYHPKDAQGSTELVRIPNSKNSYLITGLTPGVTYIVQVSAVIKEIHSEADRIQATTDVAAIDDITVLGQTDVSIQVDWQNPAAEVDHFRLTHTDPEGQEEEQRVRSSQEARTKHTIVGLYPGTEYQISVQAIKGTVEGKVSSVNGATDLDAPSQLVTTQVSEDTATVSWERARAAIDGYTLSYTTAHGSSPEIPVGRDSTTYRLVGLRPGVVHTVYIWAYKGERVSGRSSTLAETELDAPSNLLARDVTESSFTVTWDPVRAPIDGYTLTHSSSEGSSQEIRVGADQNSHALSGLRPGVLYTVYVWATRGSARSHKTSTLSETDLDAPSNLSVRDPSESSLTVTWDRVQADVDGYILTYNSSEGPGPETPVGPDGSSYTLSGLTPGQLYTLQLWAFKGAKVSRKISTDAETDMDAPKDLKASDVTQDSASLTWVPPLGRFQVYILTYRDEQGTMETVEHRVSNRVSTFAMSGLETGRSYIVSIVAVRGSKRSRAVETIFTTVGLLYPHPMDCVQIMKNGNRQSGVYTAFINSQSSRPFQVYCDMDTDGGGWLLLQRRTSGRLDFLRRWRQYIAGFGNVTDEFWIGLDKIYELTNTPTQYELRFDLGLGPDRVYAVYDNFRIAPVRQKFKLTIGKYSGTAGDAMTYHQGQSWTTMDSDNDSALGNCALNHRGAWWYKNCHLANLNGNWGDQRHSTGVNWEPWKGHLTSLDFTEMKIRPVGSGSGRSRRSARENRRGPARPQE